MNPVQPQQSPSGERELPSALRAALVRMDLVAHGQRVVGTALSGGVSSDIWRVELPSGAVCVKRALPRLKVEAEWCAPVERNSYEVAWMRAAAAIAPGAAPTVLGEDAETFSFAMVCLDEEHYPLWKNQLLAGEVSADFAAQVGDALGRIHAASAGREEFASSFQSDENFYAIRLEPYLLAAAERHPEVSNALERLVDTTAATRKALVHGDVSPKNILAGPSGPVFLDAECAWFGDPAFDLAFCLNHLLLKAMVVPAARDDLRRAFDALRGSYLSRVDWEPAEALEARTARLLPGLLLARVDGKSPVEYLKRGSDRTLVRDFATTLLAQPVERLAKIAAPWWKAVNG